MKKAILFAALGLLVVWLALEAVVPQQWEFRTREDFLRGKFDGVSVSWDGVLTLAPREAKLAGPAEEFYLSFLSEPDGTLYLGTGHSGKVYRLPKGGQPELYFQAPELDVTCLALDKKGVLYAGTSPNGKIYKIAAAGKGTEFFNPDEKYIWDLLVRESGTLLAAVGERGGIYEVSPQGEGKMTFKADQNHILCLRSTGRGELFAGSGGGGLVYRISAEGRPAVLFESPYEDVRSLAFDDAGTVYAAASGIPTRAKREEAPLIAAARPDAEVTVTVSAAAAAPADLLAGPSGPGRETGALYRIGPDGVARRLWQASDEMVYTLLWQAAEKRLLFGTGSKGRLYALERDDKVSLLLQPRSEQLFLLAQGEGSVYIIANNPGYLAQLLPEQQTAGEYLSPVLDAKTVASWGRMSWQGQAPAGTTLQLQTRSGNAVEPNSTWSDWSPPYQKSAEQVLSPRARFLQFKLLFKSQSGKVSPAVGATELFYLQTNIAPVISRLELLKPNEVYLKVPEQEDVVLGVEKKLADPLTKKDEARITIPPRKVERKGFRTVVWEAEDENGDALTYTLALRKDGEAEWRVVQEEGEEALYAFDTLALPDGTYTLRLTASDAMANAPGTELRGERFSRPFVIDNSLPVVKDFSALRRGETLEVSFRAEDGYSSLEEVKYLVRPAGWRVVFPADGICDAPSESFKLTVKLPAGAENLITVRVRDRFGNVGVFRQPF